ncbi:MAG: hypothetical protein M3083_13130 [Actinomycetota bacterium]|nr:hypothetical protein [Actinomycetota bacterium]MDQ6949135.1 hypothetical protein [Actinomycetota bacterium]
MSRRESSENGGGDLLRRPRGLYDVRFSVAKVGEPGVLTDERLEVVGITWTPLPGSGQARGEVGPQDRVMKLHTPARAPVRQPVDPLREHMAV